MKTLLALLTAGVGLASSQAAFALAQPTGLIQNPGGVCTARESKYDAALLKTPARIANRGKVVAYITCSLPVLFPNEIGEVSVFFRNPNRVKGTALCTMVNGTEGGDAPATTFYTQSYAFTAGGRDWVALVWQPSAYGLATFYGPVNLSCALPPGMELDNIGESFVDAAP